MNQAIHNKSVSFFSSIADDRPGDVYSSEWKLKRLPDTEELSAHILALEADSRLIREILNLS